MLPLVTNVGAQSATPQANTVAAAQAALQSAQAPSSRQITAMAVTAATAASAYSAQVPERRFEAGRNGITQQRTVQPERPAILPDPQLWKVPTREAAEAVATQPSGTQLIDNATRAAQFAAQAAAQQVAEQPGEEPPPAPAQQARRANNLLAKKPGIGDSSGLGAYAIAAQRNTDMSFPNSVETVI